MTEETMALADVYAESVLLAAREKGQEEEVAAQLADLVAYMDREPEFDAFLTASSVDDEPRRESLEKLFRGRMNDLLLNLLHVLNNRIRTSLVRGIHRRVQVRMDELHNRQEVIVESALPLTDDMRKALQRDISEWTGKQAIMIERVHSELIGGVVIRIGDVQVDGTVASRIESLRRRLIERGTEEIQRSRERSEE